MLCKLECFAVWWGFKLCLAIISKLKGGKKGENFGNIASISQTHLFHKFYIDIALCMAYPPAGELLVQILGSPLGATLSSFMSFINSFESI